MNSIDRSSLLKREAWLKKRLKSSENWKALQSASDYRLLKRQESCFFGLTILMGTFFMTQGIDEISEANSWLDPQILFPTFLLFGMIFGTYSAWRLRWALEAFEQFAPQELKELSDRIAGESETPRDRNPVQMEDPAGGLSQ